MMGLYPTCKSCVKERGIRVYIQRVSHMLEKEDAGSTSNV